MSRASSGHPSALPAQQDTSVDRFGSPIRVVTGVLRSMPLAVAVLFILVYVVVAALRMGYPYELEWMEGGAVDHVRRLLDGKPIYVAPSLDFIPYIYPPFYFLLSAGASWILGV